MTTPELRPSASVSRQPAPAKRAVQMGWIGGVFVVLLVVVMLLGLESTTADPARIDGNTGNARMLVLALPAFLAGLLSFLSPCCLPVLSAYAAFSVQTGRERMVGATIAFFLGLATTMIILGATTTALSRLIFQHLPLITQLGGLVVIGFGVMSLLGKGFSGPTLMERQNATFAGAYLYGATFALGWTACVGPILGALLTLLATQGIAVLQGAVLACIYALGLGTPLIMLALFARRLDANSRLWRMIRGRGFTLSLGRTTLYLHTSSIASGLLLIVVGLMLATGQLTLLSRWSLSTPLAQWVLGIEQSLSEFLLGR